MSAHATYSFLVLSLFGLTPLSFTTSFHSLGNKRGGGKFLNIFLELFDTKIGPSEELKLRLKCLNVTEKNAKKQLLGIIRNYTCTA